MAQVLWVDSLERSYAPAGPLYNRAERSAYPTRQRLSHCDEVRIEAVCSGVATRSGAHRVRLVDDEKSSGLVAQVPKVGVETGRRMDDADVRQDGFGQDAGDVPHRELA